MKPLPPPNVPGNTEFEKFDNAVKMMFSVPKEAVLKAEAEWKKSKPLVVRIKRNKPAHPRS